LPLLEIVGLLARRNAEETIKVAYHHVNTASINENGTVTLLATPIEPDKFRIKITDITPGSLTFNQVVYDNQRGQPSDSSAPDPQTIGGGSVVVHKAK